MAGYPIIGRRSVKEVPSAGFCSTSFLMSTSQTRCPHLPTVILAFGLLFGAHEAVMILWEVHGSLKLCQGWGCGLEPWLRRSLGISRKISTGRERISVAAMLQLVVWTCCFRTTGPFRAMPTALEQNSGPHTLARFAQLPKWLQRCFCRVSQEATPLGGLCSGQVFSQGYHLSKGMLYHLS